MILNIETATQICSVSLSKGNETIALRETDTKNSHAVQLSVFIEELFKSTGISRHEIKAVAISKGPGSYTGLRIGVSTAKGLAYGLNVPLISVSTLQSMAYGVSSVQQYANNSLFAPMIDARRMEVYSAFYNANNQLVKEISADIIEADSYSEFLQNKPVYFFGDGAAKCKQTILHPNAHFIDAFNPSAAFMAAIAHEKFEKGEFENLAYFEPFYLKDFIAIKAKPIQF